MLEIVLTSSESDQYLSAPKEISNFPLMYMTGYFCRSVYVSCSGSITELSFTCNQCGLFSEMFPLHELSYFLVALPEPLYTYNFTCSALL